MKLDTLDLSLLRVLKYREHYDRYIRAVPKELLSKYTCVLLEDFGQFFDDTEAPAAKAKEFIPWFKLAHPKLKEKPRAAMMAIIKAAQEDVPDAVIGGLLKRMEAHRQVAQMTTLVERYNAGEEVDVLASLRQYVDSIPMSRDDLPIVEMDADEYLDDEENDFGFKWRLSCLNRSMRPLRPGDFLIYAARVDQGKTTFMVSEAANFAPQVDQLFPDEDRCILILNNESMGKRINGRLLSATMKASVPKLVEMRHEGMDLWGETQRRWGGRPVIKVLDVHDMPMSRLEDMIRRLNPAIVFVDMIDNVPFDGGVNNGGQRTDQILEAMYQRARIWGVKYDCAVLASSQLSAEATNDMYPGLHMLANSRTGKAGAADAIIMLGSDENFPNMRYIGLPKNKLARAGEKKDPREAVLFRGAEALVVDAEVIDEDV